MVVASNFVKPPTAYSTELKVDDELPQIEQKGIEQLPLPEAQSRQPTTCAKVFALAALLMVVVAFGVFLAQCTRLYTQLHFVKTSGAVKYSYEKPFEPNPIKQKINVNADENTARIEVPQIGNFRHAMIVHDFNVKLTSIKDMDQQICMVKPMNPDISPPKNMIEIIQRMASGVYFPKPDVIRNKYTLPSKPMTTAEINGLNSFPITHSCHDVPMYRLVPKTTAEDCKKGTYVHDDTKSVHHDEVHGC